MEAPKKVWTKDEPSPAFCRTMDFYPESQVKYIRSDLVAKLEGYAWHIPGCQYTLSNGYNMDGSLKYGDCTCGLTELLKEME